MREKLIEKRRARGWTQSDLAQACGITAAQISRIERGDRGISGRLAVKIQTALQLSDSEVMQILKGA
ncbi:MAG: helix-turn-helix transcriptional regulator [Bacteroidaceae bacterium]|nr:helix-turn-helix transcriptional regulator [Bacteroidaceae bacterium]